MRTLSLVVLAALVLASWPVPAHADHATRPALLDEVWTSAGWLVVEVETTATKVWLHHGTVARTGANAEGFSLAYADGTIQFLGGGHSWQERLGAAASEPGTPAGTVTVDAVPDLPSFAGGYGWGSPSHVRNGGASQVLRIVAWSAGDVLRWNFTLALDGTSTILSRTTGTGTFLHWAEEFEASGRTVHAYAPSGTIFTDHARSVRVTDDATFSLHVADRLFGTFTRTFSWNPPLVDEETYGVRMPSGADVACDCHFRGSGPGDYAFRVDGTYVGGSDGILLAGADIPLE